MSKPETKKRVRITDGPAILEVTEDRVVLSQGGNAIAFSDTEDFMEFVNRIGIIAVRLDQAMNPIPDDNSNTSNDDNPPT